MNRIVLKMKVEFDDKTLLHIEWPATFLTFVFTPTVFEIHTKMSQLKNYVKMRLVQEFLFHMKSTPIVFENHPKCLI